jgi:hypothetical protein
MTVIRRRISTSEYQGHEALVDIATGEVREGKLPTKARGLVKEWCLEYQPALLANWDRARALESLERIPGADNDQDHSCVSPRGLQARAGVL